MAHDFGRVAAFGGLALGVAALLVGQAIDLKNPSFLWLVLSGLGFVISFAGLFVWSRGAPASADHVAAEVAAQGREAASGLAGVLGDVWPWAIGAGLLLAWALIRLFL